MSKTLFQKYEENEANNFHTENLDLLVDNFSTPQEVFGDRFTVGATKGYNPDMERAKKKAYEVHCRLYPRLVAQAKANKEI